jgi:hypothetical protein
MNWWVAVLSFLGALLGAGIPAWVNLRHQRQTARTEWRERFEQALTLATSASVAERILGDELLADLISSDLGSPSDRRLARKVSSRLVELRAPPAVDPSAPVSDNDDASGKEAGS